METSLLLTRLVLSGVLAVAAVAKLYDPHGSEKAIMGFGLSRDLARPIRTILPIVELLIAASLLFVQLSWYGSIAAASLFGAFTTAMIYQFAKGNAPDCHCFGQIHSEPVGIQSIIRNVALITLAGFLIYSGAQFQGGDIASTPSSAAATLAFATLAILGVFAILYLKEIAVSQQQLMRRVELLEIISRDGGSVERDDVTDPHEGLPVGAMFPDFKAKDIDGNTVSIADIRSAGVPTLFLFISPSCNPCNAMVPEFEDWQRDLKGETQLVYVTTGTADENKAKFAGSAAKTIIIQAEREIAESVNAFWTPTGLLMDASGRIASRLVAGDNAIREVVQRLKAGERPSLPKGPEGGPDHQLGKTVPDFEIEDIAGNRITNDVFAGGDTLVAFWSTTCPHCDDMMADLLEWENSRGEGSPRLIVFADGDVEKIENLGITSTIIHDKAHKVSVGFGMYGTPSAVLVDTNGIVVSETATGAPNIWSLVGFRRSTAA
jgi:peroxiredoxin